MSYDRQNIFVFVGNHDLGCVLYYFEFFGMNIVLDNCPFCGSSDVELQRVGDWVSQAMAVVCNNEDCDAQGPTSVEIEEAHQLWNKRKLVLLIGELDDN